MNVTETKINFDHGTIKDLKAIVSVNYTIFSGVYEVEPYTLADYKARLHQTKPLIIIARDGNQIIGDSIAFPHENTFYVWVLGVLEEYRRRGIASELFRQNEEYAKTQGHHSVTTKVYSASDGMLKLVKGRGYSVIKFHNTRECGKGDFYYKIRKNI